MPSRRRKPVKSKPPTFTAEDFFGTSPFVLERAMAEISRTLQGHDFKSAEELDAFVNKLLDKGEAEEASAPASDLEKAQDLMYSAWDEEDADDRIAIAETALVLSCDCADAFVLLGDEKAMSLAESRAYFEEGVRAGRRAIGERPFEEDVGHFWGLLETRPYMRARARLATVLWDSGERKSAIEHLEDLLRLNPGDNQGNRYLLLGMLIEEKDEVAVERLLAAFADEGSAGWLYDKALWLMVRRSPVDEISLALDDAIAANALVPRFLLGRKRTRKVLPGDNGGQAGEFEADAYALLARDRWVAATGALEHLRQAVARGKKPRG